MCLFKTFNWPLISVSTTKLKAEKNCTELQQFFKEILKIGPTNFSIFTMTIILNVIIKCGCRGLT